MKKAASVLITILIFCLLVSFPAFGAAEETTPETLEEALEQIEALKTQLKELQAAYDQLQALLDEQDDVKIDYSSENVVKMVQQALNDAGYSCGTPDGNAGSQTAEAIRSYQSANSLEVTGIIDKPLIKALGIYDFIRILAVDTVGTETETRSPAEPVDVTLRDGKYIIGEDIAPGEYRITCIETEGETLNDAYTSLGDLYDSLGEDDGWGALFGSLGDVLESVSPVTVNILGDYGSVIKTFDLKKDDSSHITLTENTALQISGGTCRLVSD